MTNQRFLELAPKIDKRYLELTGKIYELSHKKGKTVGSEIKSKVYPRIAKEFGVTEYVVRAYLRVYHLSEDSLRDMESGRPWNYYETALNAPATIRQLAYQKIKEKKDKVTSSPTLKNMDEEMKQLRQDVKENKEVLAQELADYYKDSGSLEIIDGEGNTKRIIFSVKLVKS